jgi:hypothetical protein
MTEKVFVSAESLEPGLCGRPRRPWHPTIERPRRATTTADRPVAPYSRPWSCCSFGPGARPTPLLTLIHATAPIVAC